MSVAGCLSLFSRAALALSCIGAAVDAWSEIGDGAVPASEPIDSIENNNSQGKKYSAQQLEEVWVTGHLDPNNLRQSSDGVMFGVTDLQELPFSVNVVGEDDINRRRAVGLAQILVTDPAYTPGYGAHGGGVSEGTGKLRGFDTANVIYDGIPLSDINIPETELLSRVEVLRGPASFRYGFIPPGGAINQVSKRPTEDDMFMVSTTLDSWGMFSTHIDMSTNLGDEERFGVRVNLVASKGDVFIDDVEQERRLIGIAADYRISDDTLLTLNYANTFARSDQGDFNVGNVIVDVNEHFLPGLGPKFNFTQNFVYNQDKKNRYALTLKSAIFDNLDFYTNFQYVALDEKFSTFSFFNVQPNGDATGDNGFGIYDWDDFNNTSYLTWVVDTGRVNHRISTGFTVHNSNFRNNWMSGEPVPINLYNHFEVTPTAPYDKTPTSKSETDRTGVFISDMIDIGERWHAVLGLRWSEIEFVSTDLTTGLRDSSLRNSKTSPTLGLLYDLRPGLGIYTSYSTGLERGGRAPIDASNANEQMPALESESFELGLKSEFADGVATLDAAIFAIERTSEYYLGPGTRYGQYGEARHIGAEVLLNGRFRDSLRLSGGLQYLDTEQIDTGDPLTEGKQAPLVPPFQGSLEAVYDFADLPGLSLTLRAVAQGRMELSNKDTDYESPGYVRFDASVAYDRDFGNVGLSMQLSVENMGDIVYYPGQLQYGRPLTVFAGIDLRW
ncbi:MAG: TonB-dependent receptor [Parahaliea sp.]